MQNGPEHHEFVRPKSARPFADRSKRDIECCPSRVTGLSKRAKKL